MKHNLDIGNGETGETGYREAKHAQKVLTHRHNLLEVQRNADQVANEERNP